MAQALSGITNGPMMDWTQDNHIYIRYKQWKRSWEALFAGPLSEVSEEASCAYIRYFSGTFGMDLIEGWEKDGSIKTTEGGAGKSPKKLKTYWELFQAYVTPKTNTLLAVIQLKKCFQGNSDLETFHTQVCKLVDEAGHTGDNRDRQIRDHIIGGLSDKETISKCLRKLKEGSTLKETMQLLRQEVALNKAPNLMVETSNLSINYAKYGKSKGKGGKKPGKPQQSPGSHGSQGSVPTNSKSGQKCYRCGKGRHQAGQKCPAIDSTCRNCGKKGHYERACLSSKKSSNASAHCVETSREPA